MLSKPEEIFFISINNWTHVKKIVYTKLGSNHKRKALIGGFYDNCKNNPTFGTYPDEPRTYSIHLFCFYKFKENLKIMSNKKH